MLSISYSSSRFMHSNIDYSFALKLEILEKIIRMISIYLVFHRKYRSKTYKISKAIIGTLLEF